MENERAPLISDKPPAYNPSGVYPPPSDPYPPPSEQLPYPPSSEQPPPSSTSTVTVVNQPPPVVMTTSFGESPVNITCPNCRNQVTTKTEYESGSLMWILVLVLCLIGLWPCCLIPFCVDGCKDVGHSCPVCSSRLGTYRRM